MEPVTKSPVMLYTEQTPNPESLKYVTNRMLYKGTADFKDKKSAENLYIIWKIILLKKRMCKKV